MKDFEGLGSLLESGTADIAQAPHEKKPSGRVTEVVSLFAGIGGFDLAFERAGASVAMQCELDRYCQAVLKRHWPKVAIRGDIRLLDPAEIPTADVWTAGFPCQDVSLARGNHGRSGFKGSHTSLFFRLMELVEARTPKVILLENVVGLLNSHGGRDFAVVLDELMKHGYAVSWRVLNARYFGAPQTRSRVFICAWRGSALKAVQSLFEPVSSERPGKERMGFITPTFDARTGAIVPEVAYCVAATSGRHTGNDWSRSYISYGDRVRRPTPTESERLQGFPTNWTIPASSFTESVRGLDSERYRAAGNAVAVPVVSWIANRVIRAIKDKSSRSSRELTKLAASIPDLEKDALEVDFGAVMRGVAKDDYSHRWRSGGVAWQNQVIEASVPPSPSKIIHSRFLDVLDSVVPDDRYFITANAAAGIIRRADSVGRTLFAPFRAALEHMIEEQQPRVTSRHPEMRGALNA